MSVLNLKEFTSKLNILYAEDSLTVRNITKNMLSEYFDNINIAKDGQEALDLYKKYYEEHSKYYDIVFTDLEMPVMDGQKLSEYLLEFNPTQELVIISGIDDFNKAIELINVGIKKFIAKPIEELQLLAVVASMKKKYLQESQKELATKVKELEEFSDALDVSAIVVKTDEKGLITYANNLFCKISGYNLEEILGKNINILNSGSRSKMYHKRLWNTITQKKTFKTLFENRAKDGSIYYINATISPILDTNDEIEYISVAHDMTQLMNSLEAKKAAEKSKNDFFINISHEMRTPLNAILGFASILSNRIKDDAKASMMVNSILETGNDLRSLIESILDLNKIQDNKFVLTENPFNLKNDIRKKLLKYEKLAQEKNKIYIFDVDNYLPDTLRGDLKRVRKFSV